MRERWIMRQHARLLSQSFDIGLVSRDLTLLPRDLQFGIRDDSLLLLMDPLLILDLLRLLRASLDLSLSTPKQKSGYDPDW
jgi:hypothetical protein